MCLGSCAVRAAVVTVNVVSAFDDDLEVDLTAPDLASVRIGHLSDTHLGYEAYRTLSSRGENQRSVDVARAFSKACDDLIEWDPPLVIHTGDLADRPIISVRLMLFARHRITRLAGIRPDGTRRQVILLAGNHELSSHRQEACFLELYNDIPGVQVVTDDATIITFADAGGGAGCAAPELDAVSVTCIPHDTLKDLKHDDRFDDIAPLPNRINILAAHGVAGGSGLYKRVMGREYEIPTDVLARPWAYGALGHWHRPGPIPILSTGTKADRSSGRIWYAGSTENCGFGDVLDNEEKRGWLKVTAHQRGLPHVERSLVPTRSMFRLPVLDGTGMSPEQIGESLLARIRDAKSEGRLADAVVGQIVTGVPRDIWSLVDVAAVRDSALSALHYDVTVTPMPRAADDERPATERIPGLADIAAVLVERAEVVLSDGERPSALAMSRELLGKTMTITSDDDDDGAPATDPAPDTDNAADTPAVAVADGAATEASEAA